MKDFTIIKRLMGCTFTLGVTSDDEIWAHYTLNIGVEEIVRIEKLLSEFRADSEVTKINQHPAHEPVAIDEECFQLIARAENISKLTDGAFDITTAPLKKLYQFKNSNFELPTYRLRESVLRAVGYQKLHLDKHNFCISKHESMRISFAAIGKGYAADKVKTLWQSMGVTAGYINASGDLCAFGSNAAGHPWSIGISHPEDIDKTIFHLPIVNGAVATSGDAVQHFYHRGKRYSHNISPYTGLPLTGIKSVTVVSPSAELSDALATAVYVKGAEDGIDLINQLPETHCIIIDENNEIVFSKDIQYEAA